MAMTTDLVHSALRCCFYVFFLCGAKGSFGCASNAPEHFLLAKGELTGTRYYL